MSVAILHKQMYPASPVFLREEQPSSSHFLPYFIINMEKQTSSYNQDFTYKKQHKVQAGLNLCRTPDRHSQMSSAPSNRTLFLPFCSIKEHPLFHIHQRPLSFSFLSKPSRRLLPTEKYAIFNMKIRNVTFVRLWKSKQY